MYLDRLLGLSVAGGLALTLLSGLVPVRTVLGATHYGYPLAWLVRRTLAPGAFPWRLDAVGVVVDLVLWTGLVLLVLVIAEWLRARRLAHPSTG